MNSSPKILFWTLMGLLAGNLALSAHFFKLKHDFHQHALGHVIPIVSGVRLDGGQWRAPPASCHVVRVTKDDCPYCKSDRVSYAAFRQAAQQASCEIVEFAPIAGEMGEDARDGVVQLKYLDVDLGPSIFPLGTPMTFVLDRNWEVKWMRRGVFSASTLNVGIQALRDVEANQ